MSLDESRIQIDKSPFRHKTYCFQIDATNSISNVGTALIENLKSKIINCTGVSPGSSPATDPMPYRFRGSRSVRDLCSRLSLRQQRSGPRYPHAAHPPTTPLSYTPPPHI